MNNVTLGLLVALCIIIATNMYMFEGLENMPVEAKPTDATAKPTDATIKEKKDAKDQTDTVNVVTTSADDSSKDGIDKVTMESTLRSKSANSMPVNKTDFSSDEVEPSATTTKEAFGSMSASV